MVDTLLKLQYAPPRAPGHSIWSIIGFALSVLLACGACVLWWSIIRVVRSASGGLLTISLGWPIWPAFALVFGLCGLGGYQGRKRLAAAGLIIAGIALVLVIVAMKGSPWGKNPIHNLVYDGVTQ